jgi:plasmid maintenance system antidote protein VapI
MTRYEAARTLGVTPQRVSQLVAMGMLERTDKGITPESVEAAKGRRGPGRPRKG